MGLRICARAPPAPEARPTARHLGRGVNPGLPAANQVWVSATCSTCHGAAGRPDGDMLFVTYDANQDAAPPVDTTGASSGVLVGVHLAHVNPDSSGVYGPIACTECHPDATVGGHPGDGLTVTFAAATGAGLASYLPTFTQGDGTSTATTCSTYCHGGAAGGSVSTWGWNDATPADCGSCHGYPPALLSDGVTPHSGSVVCGTCHAGYTGLAVNAATHIDGILQRSTNCSSCHGTAGRPDGGIAGATYDANQAAAPPFATNGASTGVLVGVHLAHVNPDGTGVYKPVACTECHPDDTTGTHPGNGLNVTFAAATGADLASYVPTFTQGNGTTIATTCSTYCHGATLGGGSVATWGWNDATAADCGSCHGAPPAVLSDGVTPHSTSGLCGSCHGGYTGSTVNPATHIDGTLQSSTSCSSCHGTAGRPNGGIAGASYDANQDAAPPADTTGATAGVQVGVHQAHVNPASTVYKPILCTECHPDNTTGGHPNGGPNEVTFVNATGADLAGFTPTRSLGDGVNVPTGCTTYCHGGAAGGSVTSWLWNGAVATCGSCHGAPPTVLSDGTTPHSGSTDCASCHAGYTSATVNPAKHIDGTIEGTATCTGCHGTAARANGDMALPYDANQAAAPPVDAATGASTGVLVGVHLAHVNPSIATGVYKPIACTECHPDDTAGGHPDLTRTVTFANATAADLAGYVPTRTLGNGTSATTCSTYCHLGSAGGSVTTWSWNGAAAGCGSCHGYPPTTAGHAGVTSSTNCGGCHPAYTATTVNLAVHINGQLDGGESIGGQACGGCHSAIFNAMNGTTPKSYKHTLGGVAGTNDSFLDSGITWGSPLTGIPAAQRSCVNMCHGDHPHDLTSPLVATHEYNAYVDSTSTATRGGATRTSGMRARTDFIIGEANGGLCTSCHRSPIGAGGAMISAATFGASAHDFTAASGFTWQFQLHSGAFDRNCTKCHASNTEGRTPTIIVTSSGANSVHFNSNDSLLAGSTTLTPTVTDLVCYNCHGSTAAPAAGAQGNRSGKNIQSQFAKASTHAVAGVTCRSCHDPHEAQAGTHSTPGNLAGPPIEGASGAQLTGTVGFFAAPTAGSFTAKTVVAGADVEATLCFKCHSAFGALPAGTTDAAREFNPANVGNFAGTWASGETAGGFHPVLADAGTNLGRVNMLNLVTTNLPWRTSGTRNTMTCSDCHESDTATDPNGPHGSAANFILRGPNTTWNNTMLATSAGMPAGAFCANCHSSTFASSRMPSGDSHTSRSAHRVACQNCHARIPHGGPRPGMLVAPAGAASAVGGSLSTWDTSAVYANPGSGSRLYLFSYPSGGTNSWSRGNCGCNGTGH